MDQDRHMGPTSPGEDAVFIFDGYCRLCSAAVDFIIRHDRAAHFRFAAAQSEAGRTLLARHGLADRAGDTHVLIEDGVAYTDSTATLRIARRLTAPLSWLYALTLVPAPLRDFFYRLIARGRYRLLGRRQTCRAPTLAESGRFL